MFNREHHLRIATILQSLNAELLLQHHCLFGGGTAIVLAHKEYRESVDIDFLISDLNSYSALRTLLTQGQGINAITRPGMKLTEVRDLRADRYGIRTMIRVAQTEVKLEIIQEGRIQLEAPHKNNNICGIATLNTVDIAATKLLANSDRWSDDSVFSRDLIDLAMLEIPKKTWELAVEKASAAYKESITSDLSKAIDTLGRRRGRLEECMDALKMDSLPQAVLWKRIRALKKN